jgi:predicted Zn-dependent protease
MKDLRFLLMLSLPALLFSACLSIGGGISMFDAFDTVVFIAQTAESIQKSTEELTPENEYYIGRAVAATIFGQYKPYTDARANAYVNNVGVSLAYQSNRPETYGGYHFQILDSDDINAFAAPGGIILITRGLIECAQSEDELAAILAHEVGHVVLEHGLKTIKQSRQTAAITDAAVRAGKQLGGTELREVTNLFGDSIGDVMKQMVNAGYSREWEKDADHESVVILKQAGYDPMALVRVLEVMDTRLKPGGLDFSKTHPDPKDRIRDVKGFIGQYEEPGPAPVAREKRFQAELRLN